jgi:hypothetical protein
VSRPHFFSDAGPECPLPGARVLTGPDYPDWCHPLDQPTWVKAEQATLMRDEDTVLGFEAVGQRWAIPWWVMKNHHVANLLLEGKPFLVTLCEYCAGGGLYDPVVGGKLHRFRFHGVYAGTPMIVDDASGSLWWMVNTQPLHGPALELGRLPRRPIVHSRWDEWRTTFPETWVVHGEGEPRHGHGSEYDSPDHQERWGSREGTATGDVRRDALELVVGVEVGSSSRAYPLAEVHAAGGIVVDTLGGRPIAVVARRGSWLGIAFERELGGKPIELRWNDEAPAALVDARTGSRFDLFGVCVAGAFEGARLAYVLSTLKKWDVWAITNPDSEIWTPRVRLASSA